MDWIVHGVTKSRTRLGDFHFQPKASIFIHLSLLISNIPKANSCHVQSSVQVTPEVLIIVFAGALDAKLFKYREICSEPIYSVFTNFEEYKVFFFFPNMKFFKEHTYWVIEEITIFLTFYFLIGIQLIYNVVLVSGV